MRQFRTRKRLVGVIVGGALLVLVAGAMSEALAGSFSVSIKEGALNKLAERVGPISDSGHYRKRVGFPCFHCVGFLCSDGHWDTCYITIFEADWSWTISSVTFNITTNGISYAGNLKASLGPLSYTTAVTGTATVNVSGNNLQLALSSVSVPVAFDVPAVGRVTITTINRSLPYATTVPLTVAAVS